MAQYVNVAIRLNIIAATENDKLSYYNGARKPNNGLGVKIMLSVVFSIGEISCTVRQTTEAHAFEFV